ncbi:hypothetical protein M569_06472, partial [Genlisea aurea]
MDDVDRLFECFKCGISPPQSATGEKRAEKRKVMQRCSYQLEEDDDDNRNLNRKKRPSFPAGVFYGSPNGVPPKRPARRLLRLLREIRVDLAEEKNFRDKIWSTFPKQDEAIKLVKQHPNAHVFCYQDHRTGQRRFLVSTYKEFWLRKALYKEMDSRFRHHYEVIQEGLPCHLYFDLEFNKKENTGRNGDEMVDLLITVVFHALVDKYSITADEDCLIELDSSTEEKFSRHLIIRLPNVAFKDNSHVGAFVDEICSRIRKCRDEDDKYATLFVTKSTSCADGTSHLFVDPAVYTRNRCFRLAFSSKAGKSSFLLPSGRFQVKEIMKEEEVFMASLICNIEEANTDKLLICKMDSECVKTLHFETENTSDSLKHPCRPLNFAPATCSSGRSPFPSLDLFIEAVASSGNVSGRIRAWYWFSEDALVVYSMSRNRYCERIGREHKSNH